MCDYGVRAGGRHFGVRPAAPTRGEYAKQALGRSQAVSYDDQTRGHFASHEVATKLPWRAIGHALDEAIRSTEDGHGTANLFAVLLELSFTIPPAERRSVVQSPRPRKHGQVRRDLQPK